LALQFAAAAASRRTAPARCPAVGRCRTCVGRSDDDVVEAFDGRTDDRSSGPDRPCYPPMPAAAGGVAVQHRTPKRQCADFCNSRWPAASRLWGCRPNIRAGEFQTGVGTRRQAGRRFPAPPGLAARRKWGARGSVRPPAVACWRLSTGPTGAGGPLPVRQPDSSASSTIDANARAKRRPCPGGRQECCEALLPIV
jgi:hypothetical protein